MFTDKGLLWQRSKKGRSSIQAYLCHENTFGSFVGRLEGIAAEAVVLVGRK